ncbi:hypothetical protein K8R30_01040 [archaeon]|nr:hypothetical protein [archaeon]
MNKNGLIGLMVVAGILLVVGFFWFVGELDSGEECVRVETGCCPCANGGEEICVLESEVKKIEDAKNCSGDVFCAAVYVCEITSCEYLEGECVAR